MALLACLALAALAVVSASPLVSVRTPSGSISGFQNEFSNVFLGVPFAEPPVENLRWQPPKPREIFNQTFEALKPGPGCIQNCSLPTGSCPSVVSEDCLTLNVFTPQNSSLGASLAVLVFFYGGNFRSGVSACPLYNPSQWVARENLIVVSANYRLGAFGFFFSGSVTANLGLMDQQAALIWVKQNIAAFGGDSNRISIFGQSAGATSVAAHLQNSLSQSIISGAILESIPAGIVLRQSNDVIGLNNDFAKLLGCSPDDLSCLTSVSSSEIFLAQTTAGENFFFNDHHYFEIAQPWEPVAGEITIPQPSGNPSFYIPKPEIQLFLDIPSNISIIFGSTSQEGYLFLYDIFSPPLNWLEAQGIVGFIYGLKNLPVLDKFYPIQSGDSGDYRNPLSRLLTDYAFSCPARNLSRAIVHRRSAHPQGNVNVYSYFYDELSTESVKAWGPNYPACWSHVCHGSELMFVFNSAWAINVTLTEEEQILANQIGHYWANFAKTGNPNSPGSSAPVWNPVDPNAFASMYFKAGPGVIGMKNDPRESFCEVWDGLGYSF